MSAKTCASNSTPSARHLVGQVELGGRAGLDADGRAVQILEARGLDVGVDHHPLAVVERRRREVAPAGVAADRPGGVADQDVNLAGLERRTALVGGEGTELDRFGVAEDGGRHGAAEVGVEAGVLAALVEEAEAGQAAVHAADERAAGLDGREASVGRWRCRGCLLGCVGGRGGALRAAT